MLSLQILSILPFLPVSILAATVPIVRRIPACVPDDVALVRERITHPVYFCTYYQAHGREHSPLPALNAAEMLSACQCITDMAPKQAIKTDTTAPVTDVCMPQNITMLENEFQRPRPFCAFFMGIMSPALSPIEGKSVAVVNKACRCLSAAGTSHTIPSASASPQPTTTATTLNTTTLETSTLSGTTSTDVDESPSTTLAESSAAVTTSTLDTTEAPMHVTVKNWRNPETDFAMASSTPGSISR